MLEKHNGTTWFFEDLYPDHTFGFEVSTVLVPERNTSFQKLMVLDTPRFGRVLILDGVVQLTELDECAYHETMAHSALFLHLNPKKILIIGGGDCGIAREVLKHPSVESVHLVEIDPQVVQVAKEYLPFLTQGTVDDPRLKFHFVDATTIDTLFLEGEFDVALLDTTDDSNVATPLFQGEFTEKVFRSLAPDGVMIRLGGSLFFQSGEVGKLFHDAAEVFGSKHVSLLSFAGAATYYGGPFSVVLTSKKLLLDTEWEQLHTRIIDRFRVSKVETRWYSPAIHRATRVIPSLLMDGLGCRSNQ